MEGGEKVGATEVREGNRWDRKYHYAFKNGTYGMHAMCSLYISENEGKLKPNLETQMDYGISNNNICSKNRDLHFILHIKIKPKWTMNYMWNLNL